MLKILLIAQLALILTACSTKTEYIKVPYEVKIPVKCVVKLPDGEINKSLNTSEKYVEVLKYISKLHKNIEVCK